MTASPPDLASRRCLACGNPTGKGSRVYCQDDTWRRDRRRVRDARCRPRGVQARVYRLSEQGMGT